MMLMFWYDGGELYAPGYSFEIVECGHKKGESTYEIRTFCKDGMAIGSYPVTRKDIETLEVKRDVKDSSA